MTATPYATSGIVVIVSLRESGNVVGVIGVRIVKEDVGLGCSRRLARRVRMIGDLLGGFVRGVCGHGVCEDCTACC
jgi:hypothetical protein